MKIRPLLWAGLLLSSTALGAESEGLSNPLDQTPGCMERGSDAASDSCVLQGFGQALQMGQPRTSERSVTPEDRATGGAAETPRDIPPPPEAPPSVVSQ